MYKDANDFLEGIRDIGYLSEGTFICTLVDFVGLHPPCTTWWMINCGQLRRLKDVYIKPANKHQHLHHTSCHPNACNIVIKQKWFLKWKFKSKSKNIIIKRLTTQSQIFYHVIIILIGLLLIAFPVIFANFYFLYYCDKIFVNKIVRILQLYIACDRNPAKEIW